MLISLLYIIVIFLLIVGLIIGLILFLIGIFQKKKKNGLTISGAIIGGIPVLFFIIWFIANVLFDLLASKPSPADLVGIYKISEVTKPNITKLVTDGYRLILKSDSSFILTALEDVDAPDSGRYIVDFERSLNELTLSGNGYAKGVCINRHIGSFNIEFLIGDPDSGESYYFEKVK